MKAVKYIFWVIASSSFLFVVVNLFSIFLLKSQVRENFDLLKDWESSGFKNKQAYQLLDSVDLVSIIQSFSDFYNMEGGNVSYYPVVGYANEEYGSPHLNVGRFNSAFPIRKSGGEDLPPQGKTLVYCFGGSTTFGSFVSDAQTWPSYLQYILGTDDYYVKNFGIDGYNPSQETNLLIELLKMGERPEIVIFMDGFNLGPTYDGPVNSITAGSLFMRNQQSKFHYSLPVIDYLYREESLSHDFYVDPIFSSNLPKDTLCALYKKRLNFNSVLRKSLSMTFNFTLLQVLQPIHFADYKGINNTSLIENAISAQLGMNAIERVRDIYECVYGELAKDSGWLNLHSFLLGLELNHPAYVDGIHYSPTVNKILADVLSKEIWKVHKTSNERDYPTGLAYPIKVDKNNKLYINPWSVW